MVNKEKNKQFTFITFEDIERRNVACSQSEIVERKENIEVILHLIDLFQFQENFLHKLKLDTINFQ